MRASLMIWFDPTAVSTQQSGSGQFPEARERLSAYGFDVVCCQTPNQVGDALAASQHDDHLPPNRMVILLGAFPENCTVAQYVRGVAPQAGIVALVPNYQEDTQLFAYQAGIDAFLVPQAAVTLFSAVVFSVVRRLAPGVGVAAAMAPESAATASDQAWRFAEHAWALISPQGKRVPLTTTERAFLLTLTGQPERCASHEELFRSLKSGGEQADADYGRERLSVMVSRMRRKFQAHALELPVKSLHGTGYMFFGEFSTL